MDLGYSRLTPISTGTLGNVTSMAVLLRARMRGKSVYLFLLLLAVADTAVLYVSAFQQWVRVVTGFSLISLNTASCRSVVFLTLVSQVRQPSRNALFDALHQLSGTHYRKLFSVVTLLSRLKTFLFSQVSLLRLLATAAWPSASKVMTLWRYTNLFIKYALSVG